MKEKEKVLVLTVGGSAAPLLKAHQDFEPDFTYFLCSSGPRGSQLMVDGQGEPCGDKRKVGCPECGAEVPLGNPKGKALIHQMGINHDRYEKVEVDDPDNLEEVLSAFDRIHGQVSRRFPHAKPMVNYTGGTKTMSAGAVVFSLSSPQWELSLNKGPRSDLIRVTTGDQVVAVNTARTQAQLLLDVCRRFLEQHEYFVAGDLLRTLLQNQSLGLDFQSRVLKLRNLCEGFGLWDQFAHQDAGNLFQRCGPEAGPWTKRAKEISGLVSGASPYLPVADLVLNARRRQTQKRFDDAVARIYRAVELLAQIRLRQEFKLETGNLQLESLPENLRDKYAAMRNEKGVVQAALVRAYELLGDLGDPLGVNLYEDKKKILWHAITIRNNSILAHGEEPVREAGYRESGAAMLNFVEVALETFGGRLDLPQLPADRIIAWAGL